MGSIEGVYEAQDRLMWTALGGFALGIFIIVLIARDIAKRRSAGAQAWKAEQAEKRELKKDI